MNIGIVGAGGWGTALGMLLTDNGHKPLIWSHEKDVVNEINNTCQNHNYLPGLNLPSSLKATYLTEDLDGSDVYVFAVPTQFIRPVLTEFTFNLNSKLIVNVAKGIEKNSLMRVSEIFADATYIDSENYVILSGPSHAEEVALKMPTTVVAASEDIDSAKEIQSIFSTPNFRVYTTDDVIGCEIGGSLKNVIAIAAGIIDGLGLGDNTKAALITRGLAEISRLGIALGANPVTFSGLSGLGDLIVTCNSRHSRNRFVGEQLGKGFSLDSITSEMQMIAEGISTTKSAFELGKKHGVELPITEQTYRILFEGINPLTAIQDLMTRQSKREWWW